MATRVYTVKSMVITHTQSVSLSHHTHSVGHHSLFFSTLYTPAQQHHHRVGLGGYEAQEEDVATATVVALQHRLAQRPVFVQSHLFAFGSHQVVYDVAEREHGRRSTYMHTHVMNAFFLCGYDAVVMHTCQMYCHVHCRTTSCLCCSTPHTQDHGCHSN